MIIPSFTRVPWKQLLIGVAILVLIFGLMSWRAACTRAEQAEDQATIADARTGTASAAIDIIADNAAADTQTQNEVKEAQDAVRQADPADRERVARSELCKLQGRSPC